MIEAMVQAGTMETPYRRAGSGAAVLMLTDADDAAADGLFDALAARFRVYAPELPAAGIGPLEEWLRGLIDGLGLVRPAVVARVGGRDLASSPAGGPAATRLALDRQALGRFAASDPDRVGRLALLDRAGGLPADGAAPGDLVEFLAAPAQATTGIRSFS